MSIRAAPTKKSNVELPTLGVAVTLYSAFFVLTWNFARLPLWLAAPLGAVLLAWHGSLQHETIHGHPTPWRWVNGLIGSAPLSLWIPYPLYRLAHMRHHRFGGRHLTDPLLDPESFYLIPGAWATMGAPGRMLARLNCTLAGRTLVGPLLAIGAFFAGEMAVLRAGNRVRLWIWLRHTFGVVAVLGWVVGICHIPTAVYLGFVIYPATSLTLLRSFAEHRANADPTLRTAVVEANPFWSLIFLNNNLHIAHHALPNLAWYALPGAWRRMRDSSYGTRASEAGMVFHGGYAQVARTFMLRPVIAVEHPSGLRTANVG